MENNPTPPRGTKYSLKDCHALAEVLSLLEEGHNKKASRTKVKCKLAELVQAGFILPSPESVLQQSPQPFHLQVDFSKKSRLVHRGTGKEYVATNDWCAYSKKVADDTDVTSWKAFEKTWKEDFYTTSFPAMKSFLTEHRIVDFNPCSSTQSLEQQPLAQQRHAGVVEAVGGNNIIPSNNAQSLQAAAAAFGAAMQGDKAVTVILGGTHIGSVGTQVQGDINNFKNRNGVDHDAGTLLTKEYLDSKVDELKTGQQEIQNTVRKPSQRPASFEGAMSPLDLLGTFTNNGSKSPAPTSDNMENLDSPFHQSQEDVNQSQEGFLLCSPEYFANWFDTRGEDVSNSQKWWIQHAQFGLQKDGELFPSGIRISKQAQLHDLLSSSLLGMQKCRVMGNRVVMWEDCLIFFTYNDAFDAHGAYIGKQDDLHAKANSADLENFFGPTVTMALGFSSHFTVVGEYVSFGEFSITVASMEEQQVLPRVLDTIVSIFVQLNRCDDDSLPRIAFEDGKNRDGYAVRIPLLTDTLKTATSCVNRTIEFCQIEVNKDQQRRLSTAKSNLCFQRCSCSNHFSYILEGCDDYQEGAKDPLQLRFVGNEADPIHKHIPFDVKLMIAAVEKGIVSKLELNNFLIRDVSELRALKTLFKRLEEKYNQGFAFTDLKLKESGMETEHINEFFNDDAQQEARLTSPSEELIQRSYGLCGIYHGSNGAVYVRKYLQKKTGTYVLCSTCKKNADKGGVSCGNHGRAAFEAVDDDQN